MSRRRNGGGSGIAAAAPAADYTQAVAGPPTAVIDVAAASGNQATQTGAPFAPPGSGRLLLLTAVLPLAKNTTLGDQTSVRVVLYGTGTGEPGAVIARSAAVLYDDLPDLQANVTFNFAGQHINNPTNTYIGLEASAVIAGGSVEWGSIAGSGHLVSPLPVRVWADGGTGQAVYSLTAKQL